MWRSYLCVALLWAVACTESNPNYDADAQTGTAGELDALSADGSIAGGDQGDITSLDGGVALDDVGTRDGLVQPMDAEMAEDAGQSNDAQSADDARPMDDALPIGDAGPTEDVGPGEDAGPVDDAALPPDDAMPIDIDADEDGFPVGEDCDDGDPNIFPGALDRCDEIDNDCDGRVDEEWAQVGEACNTGQGECAAQGTWACLPDGLGVICDARQPMPSPEVCDDLDNDCDGELDEGLVNCCQPGTVRQCGREIGLCTLGIQTCAANGEYGECLAGIQPREERCDFLDDDCDGAVDESFNVGGPCEVRQGQCLLGIGVVQCDLNGGTTCFLAERPIEACNGRDDDCDGATDEGVVNACGECGPLNQEECNQVDDDCDGRIDEELGPECEAPCQPTPEICNAVDDDCDGDIDEDVLNACGQCGVVPLEECNGSDDDCDGDVDEGLLNACGQCGPVPAEACNGGDDDCDGETDEGLLNACGQCGPLPAEECNGDDDDCDGDTDEGVLNACGQCGPLIEECNGQDDDCDGQVDETNGLCIRYIGSVRGEDNGFGIGREMIHLGDLDGDQLPDIVASGYDQNRGQVVAISGVELNRLWDQTANGPLGFSLAPSLPDDSEAELLAGAPRGFDGVIHRIDREGEEQELYRGDDGFKLGFSMSTFPREPGLAISHSEFGAFRGAILFVVGDDNDFIQGSRLGERFGERVFMIPDLDGDGAPDMIATARYSEGLQNDRGTVYLPSSEWNNRSGILRVGDTGNSFGESIVWGRLLGDDPVVFAYGAPEYSGGNRQSSGAIYLVNRNGQVIAGPFLGRENGGRIGRRLATYSRPEAEQDWLVAGGSSLGAVEFWRFEREGDEIGIAERIQVPVDDVGQSFGYSISVTPATADGRSLLYVGEPESGNRGRVHVFWLR